MSADRSDVDRPVVTVADPDDPHGRPPAYDGPLSGAAATLVDGTYRASELDPATGKTREITLVIRRGGVASVPAANTVGTGDDQSSAPVAPVRRPDLPKIPYTSAPGPTR